MTNAIILLNLLATLAAQSIKVTALLQKTAAEGRDPTDLEIDDMFADDDTARAAFQKHIDAAKAADGSAGVPPV